METSPKVEREVIKRCKAGDGNAFRTIVLTYQKRVFNTALRMMGNREEAKELSQEVFISVLESIRELREAAKFESWLMRITLNHCRNRWKYLKRRQYYQTDSLNDPIETEDGEMERQVYDPSGNPETFVEKKMIQQFVQKGLLRLKEEQREMIVLRDLQGYSYEEIGKMLSLPEGTIKSRLHRARMDLKEILERFMH
jgi:RNA polymerase sigma-70 factor (ECF subfamily)